MRQAVSPERMFRFLEDVSAPVNWPRIQATNVSQIERTNDIESLTSFLADCAVGDADDGFIDFDSRAEKVALKHLQLSIQYLLHSREALRHRQRTLSQGSRRLSRREENAKKRLMRRKSQANILKAELERQNDALSTYHTILQARDPDLAARLTRDNQGRVVVAAEDNCNIDLRASVGIEEDDGGETTTTSAEDSDDSSSLYSSLSSSDEDSQPRSQADDDDDPRDGVVLLLNPHLFGSSRALCIAKRSRSYFCLQDESGRGTCSVEVASPDDSRRFEIAQDVEIGVYETSFYEGKLGYRVWDCSVAASTWCALNKDIFVGKRVLELGSGVGLVGLAIALLGAAAVDLTDLDGEDVDNPSGLISNLKRNIELNNLENVARARRLDWREGGDDTEYDVVVACDCVYYPEIVLPLAETIKRFLVNGQGRAVAYVISPDRDWTDAKYPRASFQDLRLALESIDCTIISTTPFLSRSPLSSQPDSLLLMEVGFTPTTTDEAWRSTTY